MGERSALFRNLQPRGLFAKYIISLVGLVVVVLLVNGALESWVIYRDTRIALKNSMTDKATAYGKLIEQTVTELERQISWVTRASVNTTEQRRADYTLLLSQQPEIRTLSQRDERGQLLLRVSRRQGDNAALNEAAIDPILTEALNKGVSYHTSTSDPSRPLLSIAIAHSSRERSATIAEIDLQLLANLIEDKAGDEQLNAYVIDASGRVLASSIDVSRVGNDDASLPQIQALLKSSSETQIDGTDASGHSVIFASKPIPLLNWHVVIEQPASEALKPISEVLKRIALLVALGLIVALAASTILARRMLVPIRALRDGAERIGAGDFSHRINVSTSDELEELAGRFNTMAGQLRESYTSLEAQVEARTRDLAQTIDQLAAARDVVQQQADTLQLQKDQLTSWNHDLETRVEKQIGEIERIRKLERFLAPQVAQLIASSDGDAELLSSHRREVTVVFCDLRGFTAFTESTEPEEAMDVLREYHTALGELIFRYEGTLDRYAGDGVMILFNAPIEMNDHTARALRMAVEMRETIGALCTRWRSRGHSLGFGIGIARGYATLGQIGFEQRLEYAAIGSVTNLASRLCDEAKAGQIIVSQRAFGTVSHLADARDLDALHLKGFNTPVLAVEILQWRGQSSKAS